MTIGTLRCISFYTLEIIDWDEDGEISFRIEWREEQVIFDRIKIT